DTATAEIYALSLHDALPILEQLATLQSKFDENVLDATNAWSKHIRDERELAGLPAPIVERARSTAAARNEDGWLFTLDAPNYQRSEEHTSELQSRENLVCRL